MLAHIAFAKGGIRISNKPSIFRSTVAPNIAGKPLSSSQHIRLYITLPKQCASRLLQATKSRVVTGSQIQPVSSHLRNIHTSPQLQKKSTGAIRRERAAAAPQPPSAMKHGLLFEKDSRTFFLVLTGVAALQAIFFLSAAEFYWQYDVSVVDGMNAGSNFLSRLTWPAFFVGISAFLPVTRHFFGSRYVQKLELLPNQTVNVWTYDFFARPKVTINAPVTDFKYGSFNDKGDYYKFQIRGHRWFFIMDKKGTVPDPNALYEVANGKMPKARF